MDEYGSRELMAQDCDTFENVDKKVLVSCDKFVVPRKRLQIKILSATYGRSNSLQCQGRHEDRCYDFDPKITNMVASA